MATSLVVIDRRAPLFLIGINRFDARNSVNASTAQALFSAFHEFDSSAAYKIAVLYGIGGTFCAGADLKGVAGAKVEEEELARKQANPMEPVTEPRNSSIGPMGPSRMLCTKPVIAAVEGYAVAGGFELACLCDIRIAASNATFGVFCRRWGVPLIDGGTARLPALIGLSRALDIILTGRPVGAEEALQMGLVNRVVPPGKALEEAEKYALNLCRFPQLCMNLDRRSAYYSVFDAKSLTDALDFEFRNGVEAIKAEGIKGAQRFAKGTGRGGSFAAFQQNSLQPSSTSSSSASNDIRAVFFDLGGVILDSPVHAIMRYEKAHQIPDFGLNRLMGASKHFHALEEGRLTARAFVPLFQAECDAAGYSVNVGELFGSMTNSAQHIRPAMLNAVKILRDRGIVVCAITNNWFDSEQDKEGTGMSPLHPHFEHIFQSCVLGIRKPNEGIYRIALETTKIPPHQAIFVDDITRNLKAAKNVGMKTVKVGNSYEPALVEIAKMLGWEENALFGKESHTKPIRAAL